MAVPAVSSTPKPEIGHVELITKSVIGTLRNTPRDLKTRVKIHQNEVIATADESEAELILADETKLAAGPNSQIMLDSFVYERNRTAGEIVINATKGTFRFINGNSVKSAYTIKTPASTIGVAPNSMDS